MHLWKSGQFQLQRAGISAFHRLPMMLFLAHCPPCQSQWIQPSDIVPGSAGQRSRFPCCCPACHKSVQAHHLPQTSSCSIDAASSVPRCAPPPIRPGTARQSIIPRESHHPTPGTRELALRQSRPRRHPSAPSHQLELAIWPGICISTAHTSSRPETSRTHPFSDEHRVHLAQPKLDTQHRRHGCASRA